MTKLAAKLRTLQTSDKGATMVEYGLLVVLIALVAAVGATILGVNLNNLFAGIDLTP